MTFPSRRRCIFGLVLLCAAHAAAPAAASERLRGALRAACAERDAAARVLDVLGGGIVLGSEALDAPPGLDARRQRLLLPDGTRIRLDRHVAGGRLRQVIVEFSERRGVGSGAASRPVWWLVADGDCRVRVARRLEYRDDGVARAVEVFDASLTEPRQRLELDAAVPPAAPAPGVPVAMVDSGVNYTLEAIAARLARDASGAIVGHDYWDDDARPFDSHPSASPFLPQRHGTRTASLLLDEAPVASLVPMRYPRGHMSRMRRLVADAAAAGVRIVNLSLGGDDADEWRAFERAARAHPALLFVASAGNDGRDIDEAPVYPAALALDNLITVTSSDGQGLPARGSNWGRRNVDLMVPAEAIVTRGFDGYARLVAGSSYAAVRVSALAACLLAAHPRWTAPQLKQALFAMAERPVHRSVAYVAVGSIAEPVLRARGACAPQPARAARLGTMRLGDAALYPDGPPGDAPFALRTLRLAWIRDSGWPLERVIESAATAARIHLQCGLRFAAVDVELVELPRRQHYYDTATAHRIVSALPHPAPVAWFVRDTLQPVPFDAEAIGRSNARGREPLIGSLWLTAHLEHPGVALAHELYHLLADTGHHATEPENLMHGATSPHGTRLTESQCLRLQRVGKAFDWIDDASR